ncbi:MAG TPA: cysteine dioxygenase family protein [Acidimicrobiales bacterium]|nr:cysteine dioxygenase family protein [Acidimicrobiales bacterium]
MATAFERLVSTVEGVLGNGGLADDRARAEAMAPAMRQLLADPSGLPAGAEEPLDGQAVGNLLHSDPAGRFHVLSVVFPEGTSSGVHHHGCWGVIGYLRGGDEETRYRARSDAGDRAELDELSRHVWHQGDVTYLLPDQGEGWHRVRNPGPGTGVSIHVLCRTPADHPHRYWDRGTGAVVDFPFVEARPGRWRAELAGELRPPT